VAPAPPPGGAPKALAPEVTWRLLPGLLLILTPSWFEQGGLLFSRPFGTQSLRASPPKVKTLGYFRVSLRDGMEQIGDADSRVIA
jgi:hypothetical protein